MSRWSSFGLGSLGAVIAFVLVIAVLGLRESLPATRAFSALSTGDVALVPVLVPAFITAVIAGLTLWTALLAKRTLQAGERPLLVDVPPSAPPPRDVPPGKFFFLDFRDGTHKPRIEALCAYASKEEAGVFISFPLRNVGPGLAQIKKVELESPDFKLEGKNVTIRKPQVPAGETTRIDIAVLKDEGSLELGEEICVRVNYSDGSGSQRPSVSVRLSPGHRCKQRYVNILDHHRSWTRRKRRSGG
jgi:hypothetical protein